MIDGSLILMENFPVVGQIHQQYKKLMISGVQIKETGDLKLSDTCSLDSV